MNSHKCNTIIFTRKEHRSTSQPSAINLKPITNYKHIIQTKKRHIHRRNKKKVRGKKEKVSLFS